MSFENATLERKSLLCQKTREIEINEFENANYEGKSKLCLFSRENALMSPSITSSALRDVSPNI
jgi:hypothetical protein